KLHRLVHRTHEQHLTFSKHFNTFSYSYHITFACLTTSSSASFNASASFDISFPPACAISGLPPPPPPQNCATSFTILPAWNPCFTSGAATAAAKLTLSP